MGSWPAWAAPSPAGGALLAPGGGGHLTSPGKARALGGRGWAQSILVPLNNSTKSLKSGSMRSEGRSPSSLAASLSAPREMRYLGCKGQPWLRKGGGLQDAHPCPRVAGWGSEVHLFFIFPGEVRRKKPDLLETTADFCSFLLGGQQGRKEIPEALRVLSYTSRATF